ncbi:MAG: DUF669 domain-containing protein [Roseomonas sp.]|nr:DUF669 domain-containing protein [Roseomonas sp.]MCA3328614.1 DUF669 domain-containing protein [Roseomonas sp.]MCA3332964.1 DUF669 domain-containing protein [Roseomonas sp.]MCA3356131.1 DUF669 domain-containing protein [Roseomonas sp.]MCA3386951.1 DUF669 domain-containing protein [Roseomonas sp.]
MASLNGTFDATEVAPAVPLEVLPPGKYLAHLIESEMAPTKAGDGQLLKLVFEILEGPSARRKIFDQLNLVNRNQQTVEIAQRTLSAICHAVGQVHVSDSEQLHFKPLLMTLKVEPAGNDKHGVYREARNKVAGYAAANAGSTSVAPSQAAPPPRPAAAAPSPAARPGTGGTPPWRRT